MSIKKHIPYKTQNTHIYINIIRTSIRNTPNNNTEGKTADDDVGPTSTASSNKVIILAVYAVLAEVCKGGQASAC